MTSELFYKIDDLQKVWSITSVQELKLFLFMLQNADADKNTVSIPAPRRREIIQLLGISSPAISHGLKRLKEKGLISGEQGYYTIDPGIVSKHRYNVLTDGK